MQDYKISKYNLPIFTKTSTGLDVAIYYAFASETYPYIGMYQTEGEWYPHRWSYDGCAFNSDGIQAHPLNLPLFQNDYNPNVIIEGDLA